MGASERESLTTPTMELPDLSALAELETGSVADGSLPPEPPQAATVKPMVTTAAMVRLVMVPRSPLPWWSLAAARLMSSP
jgi:hypothetical protein